MLISVYCLGVYCSQLWEYKSGKVEVFYVACRKAIQKEYFRLVFMPNYKNV